MKKISTLLLLLMGVLLPWAANAQTTNQLLSENFDSMSSISTSYSGTGWFAYNAGNGNNWTLNSSSSYAHSGSKSAQYTYSSSSAANCYLVSTPFTVDANMTELSVSLYEAVRSNSYQETFDVFFVKANDATSAAAVVSATHYSAIASANYSNTSFAQKTGSVANSALAGQSVRVVVHCTSAADKWNLYVDDIVVTETVVHSGPYITLAPTSATVVIGSTQTLTATTGNVSGTPSISYSSSNTSVATVSGSGTTATVTGVDSGTATITATMTYQGTSYTATCAVTVAEPSYCTPVFNQGSNNYGIWITGFSTTEGETNINTSGNGLSTNGYGNYYDSYSASAEAGQTINFTVITGNSVNAMIYSMWIDWNNDGDFSDSDETVAQQTSGITTNWTGTIHIPASASVGNHRIRIVGMYSGSGTLDPCISATYGEAEDYKLIVLPAASCPKPSNLQLTALGNEVTATWEGSAVSYNIDINGTVTPNATTTNSYTFTGNLSTTYTIKVQANCEGNETSDWSNQKSVTTDDCLFENQCPLTITLTDAYGDGGGKMQVVNASNSNVLGEFLCTGASAEYTLYVCNGTTVNFVFAATDSYAYENGWVITNPDGEVISQHEGCATEGDCTAPTNGVVASYTMACSSCHAPSDLQASQVSTTSAVLGWSGTNDSYVMQYRTAAQDINMSLWHQIGDDETATADLETYTYDLSDFSGSGYVAIRHYNVTNQFRLAIDDITVTDSNGDQLFSEGFESGSIPSTWTNQDVDGDSHVWAVIAFSEPATNGTYSLVSDSWSSDALFPDNWIIFPVSDLGGTLSFVAKGVDSNFPSEVFGVFVTTASLSAATAAVAAGSWSQEYPTTATSYPISNLTANTAYEWHVKGICDGDESGWVSSSFSTIADGTKTFVNAGSWNDGNNWFPTGVPTIQDKAIIAANATIPAGVVAKAKKIVLNGGTITIQDGGQLKQNGSVDVIFEKEISGYGIGDANWYFIASPLTTTRLTYMADWSYVNALDGNYDLYTFDPTASDGLEWINYRFNSEHSGFTSGSNNPVLASQNGYLYAHEDYIKLQFEGSTAAKSNNNVITENFTYDATSEDEFNGWALVGNPYTCNAYISYVDANGNSVEADFYTLNNDNTYSLLSSSQPLAPGTGAFINYSATGKVQYATEAPSKKTSMLNMNLVKGNKTVDQARVRFGEGYNFGKMSFRKGSSKLYMPVEGKDYAVVYTEEQGTMPVNFKAEENGSYTLSFNTENVELGYLHLIDNMTGNDVDLLANPSYSFNAKTSDYENRFKLVFATGNNANDDSFAFFSNGSFVINNEGEATLQVIDINGRILKSESINGCANVNVNAAQGIYMLRLVNGDSVKVQKVVVR